MSSRRRGVAAGVDFTSTLKLSNVDDASKLKLCPDDCAGGGQCVDGKCVGAPPDAPPSKAAASTKASSKTVAAAVGASVGGLCIVALLAAVALQRRKSPARKVRRKRPDEDKDTIKLAGAEMVEVDLRSDDPPKQVPPPIPTELPPRFTEVEPPPTRQAPPVPSELPPRFTEVERAPPSFLEGVDPNNPPPVPAELPPDF